MSFWKGATMAKQQDVKEKLILATIEWIEECGVQNITSRKIIKRADVNLAAINYHFNSKDNLIEIALNQTLDEAFENMIDEELLNKQYPKFALYSFFLEFLKGGLKYPGITKAHLYKPIMENEYDTLFTKRWNSFLQTFIQHLSKMLPNMNEEEIELAIIQTFSSIIFICLAGKLFQEETTLDLSNPKHQQKFIRNLIAKNFHK